MANKVLMKFLKTALAGKNPGDAAPESFSKERVKSILLINTTAIGDTLMCTPAIRAIREGFPEARVTMFAGKGAMSVLKGNPHIDAFIDSPGKVNMNYLVKINGIVKKLKAAKIDLAVVLHGNDPEAVPIACMSGARFRLGMGITEFKEHLTWYRPAGYDAHVVEERLRALEPLGIESIDTQMEIFLSPDEEAASERLLVEAGIDGPFVCLHPFGSKPTRQWSVEKAAELAGLLASELGLKTVLLGGAKEKEGSRQVVKLSSEPVFATAGLTDIRVSAAIIKRSALTISTDSGPMHIAQAFNVPTIALIGSTLALSTGPVNKEAVVIQDLKACDERRPCKLYKCDHISCMNAITTAEVMKSVRETYRVPA
ncbi:MAG: glycosyltransferase family 9 protein [Thermodesulfobacteriota bacterium]